jgi:eukaryotic-like serine/threonine-protein kinase
VRGRAAESIWLTSVRFKLSRFAHEAAGTIRAPSSGEHMATPAKQSSVFRFGAFQLNAASGGLHRAGRPVKIHPQPFRVLLLLAERSGQLVSREEIRHCLWGDNTAVEFEAGINFCVRQIRTALADDAENPRYVQTLPRRGYRFIASISFVEPDLLASAPGATPPAKLPLEEREELADSHDILLSPSTVLPAVRPRWYGRTVGGTVLAFLLTVLIIAITSQHFHRSLLTQKDSVVLGDFVNTTGDGMFDDALKQALAMELEQSPFLNLVPDAKVRQTLTKMGRPNNERITADVGRELCQRTGSKALLEGKISTLGSHYLVGLNAVACSSGDTLANEQGDAVGKEDVLKALSRAASRLRARLGESLPSVEKFDFPVEATTTSLEALKSYSKSRKVTEEQGDAASIPFYQRAIDLDPNFAIAYAGLAARYSNLNQPSLALAYAAKAYQLRDRVSDQERLLISARYFRLTGELEKQAQIFQLWMEDYPRDATPHGSLGVNYVYMGQYAKALAEWQKALQLVPGDVAMYENMGSIYVALDQLDQAKATFDEALQRKLDGAGIRAQIYYLAFLHGDAAQMERQVVWAMGKPGAEDILLAEKSDTEAYYGRLNSAREFSHEAADSAVRSGSSEAAAFWLVTDALREAEFGETTKAKEQVKKALSVSPGRNVKLFAALTLARIGATVQAKKIMDELEEAYPSNTVLMVYRLPAVKAAIALQEGRPSRALELLEAVKPYELGQPTPSPLQPLYPAYLRGEAYLALHKPTAAAKEFQKLLDHPGIARNFPLAVLAHLQIAQAYALEGDTLKARTAYQDFLNLWKDADPDIPVLRQAKTEYVRLR